MIAELDILVEQSIKDLSTEKEVIEQSSSTNINDNSEMEELSFIDTPKIPPEVYEKLPKLLRMATDLFETNREKDIYLTGLLPVLSGCFPNWWGVYGGKTIYPTLYIFMVAPASSGKGLMNFARHSLEMYHEKLREESKEAHKLYKIAKRNYDLKEKKGNLKDTDIEPEEPSEKMLFIPADSSCASFVQSLAESDGVGVLFCTEADTLGNVLKQDWGGYSDKMRLCWHHETIESKRKSKNEYHHIKRPKLSIALSGTPGQVAKLISSAEDGLFSRFVYYIFDSDIVWTSPAPQAKNVNLDLFFEELSSKYMQLIKFQKDAQIGFELSEDQWKRLDLYFSEKLPVYVLKYGKSFKSIVFRSGVMVFRIAMLLTILDLYESIDNGQLNLESSYTCSDKNFNLSLEIIGVYMQHAILMYEMLPKEKGDDISPVLARFYSSLPNEFQRKQAVEIGLVIEVKERTVDKYTQRLFNLRNIIFA